MTDAYPASLEIEIDRPLLCKYLRLKWLLSWMLLVGIFGVLAGTASTGSVLDQGVSSLVQIVAAVALGAGVALGTTLLLGGASYLLFSHRLAARFADRLRVSVEGPFLRIRQCLLIESDRKLHFRAIVDYAATQDPLMRLLNIHVLQMTTTAGGPASTITIPGVQRCLQTRDILADIDRLRENEA